MSDYKSCVIPPYGVLVKGNWTIELKPKNKTNPRGFVVCDSSQIVHNPNESDLGNYLKGEKLRYDKNNIDFNYESGENLYCNDEGCWLMEEIKF